MYDPAAAGPLTDGDGAGGVWVGDDVRVGDPEGVGTVADDVADEGVGEGVDDVAGGIDDDAEAEGDSDPEEQAPAAPRTTAAVTAAQVVTNRGCVVLVFMANLTVVSIAIDDTSSVLPLRRYDTAFGIPTGILWVNQLRVENARTSPGDNLGQTDRRLADASELSH